MKLIEALEVLRTPLPEDAVVRRAYLACGFTPLHLQTFLAAELRRQSPEADVVLEVGVFGDLVGNLESAARADVDLVAAVVEWADVDPRLGIRSLGGWRSGDVADILQSAQKGLSRLAVGARRVVERKRLGLCLPTLPLPPLFHTRPEEAGTEELHLRALVASFAAEAAGDGVRIINPQALDELSPAAERLDVRAELATGFPFTIRHASAVGSCIASVVAERQRKKGLITDLDDTLWAGLVGEVGVDGIGWTLDVGAQAHGLYQQLLGSLASAGVLIGVASKNEPEAVGEVFGRGDLLLRAADVFPVEVNWGSKAASVARILAAWNVGPESVVFVDDSPTEVADVGGAFPELECLVFPVDDPEELWSFMRRIRSLFGKQTLSDEDALRVASVRSTAAVGTQELSEHGYSDEFLTSLSGSLTFELHHAVEPRALELINKTNQFNLNGRRFTEAALHGFLEDPDSFLFTVSYKDRFGPLGKIAVLLASRQGPELRVASWVLSCRAFSRRIEHHTLAYLLAKFDVDRVILEYQETPRNVVLQRFLGLFDDVSSSTGSFVIVREAFADVSPALVHDIAEGTDG